MKKNIILYIAIFLSWQTALAQNDTKYRRSSIYSLMVKHDKQTFADDIGKVFLEMPVPDKYNNHDLSVKIVSVSDKKLDGNAGITEFLDRNMIASRLVGKWFNRDVLTGQCDMQLIKDRGLYNASEFDKNLASRSQRRTALLEDAGEELIGNTFVIVNDIRYIDRSKGSAVVGIILKVIGAGLQGMQDAQARKVANNNRLSRYNRYNRSISQGPSVAESFNDLAEKAESYKGFNVKIHSYLYRLVWDDETASRFYNDAYTDSNNDDMKRANFERQRGSYRLEYVGEQESSGSKISFLGIKEEEPMLMVRKACQRALDENVANLQRNFDVFKVKVPLAQTDPITVPIGRKEGVNDQSKYEVLEVIEDENGRTKYKRVGTIMPQKGKIWDNRFMAAEERAQGYDLGVTTFRKVSGGTFYPGMLIREIK
jgi:hypothetical protein